MERKELTLPLHLWEMPDPENLCSSAAPGWAATGRPAKTPPANGPLGKRRTSQPACFSQHSSKLWTPELGSNPRVGAGVARLKTPGRAEVQDWEKRAAESETVLIKNIAVIISLVAD